MEIKYTDDGRKVVVIGALNSKQHIVQEIFVSGDQELPSGDNFVVERLHDTPVESYKEKRIRDIERQYERALNKLKEAENDAQRKLRNAVAKASMRADALLAFAKNSDEVQLTRLHAFLSGSITHVFMKNSHSPLIVTWDDDRLYQRDMGRVEALRLVTLMGDSKGRLSYTLNSYSDGSGVTSSETIPCCGYDEALAEAQQELNNLAAAYLAGNIGYLNISAWQKIDGITIPDDALAKYRKAKRDARDKEIAKVRAHLEKLEADETK